MQIEYCALCHKIIGDEDFAEAKAFLVRGEPYCRICKEKLPEPLRNEAKNVAPRRTSSSSRLKIVEPRCSTSSARLKVIDRTPAAPAHDRSASDPRQTPGNSGDSHDLKLYWCETCGRRLTNEDLATGEARDKQVKGIYCKRCAPGVLTMQFDAIKTPLLQACPPSTAAYATQKAGKPSAANLPVAERKISKAHVRPARTSRLSTQFNVLIIGGIVSLVVLILALMMSGSSGREKLEARAAAEKRKADVAARLAEEKRKADEAGQKNEVARLEEERRLAEDKRKAEEAKLEEEKRKLAEERQKLDEVRLAMEVEAKKKNEISKTEIPPQSVVPLSPPAVQPLPPTAKDEGPDWPQDEYKPFYQLVIRKPDDLNGYKGDGDCKIEFANTQGRACMRVTNGVWNCCCFYHIERLADTAGIRLRFRYFADNCKELEIQFQRSKPILLLKKAKLPNFVNDKWTWGALTTQQAGFDGYNATLSGNSGCNGPDAYLLIDKIVWDKK